MTMQRYLCVHGHFYQPPRENPWLEAIELQDSAYPYHDWNERITAECYAPNGVSRILAEGGQIESIVNNYSRISFNFGPTLLSWMQERSPRTYEAILAADRESRLRFSGHGSALAQVYNHMILPLANRRDRWTQVVWGIRDFQHRFGRKPEGMWLAETAADLESLDILAEQGIRFTILAPNQARRVRRAGARAWRDVGGSRIDPTVPYEVRLPSGRTIAVFFYDGPVSRAVAFEKLLENGERFADRLMSGFSDERTGPQLVSIATDGETYGHHHANGDMALGYALQHIEAKGLARLTNYAEFLDRHPPTHRAEIYEKSSWSCAHGVERWWHDCGCNSGMNPGWNQSWRMPLRDALDWLRDSLAPRYEDRARRLLKDPWAARDDYIDVVLDRTPEGRRRFWDGHAATALDNGGEIEALKLLELQRHAMLMYTSCGWFFDELSGIETVQVIQYAARAIQLSREALDYDPEPEFMGKLAHARSNLSQHGDGAAIYEKFVRPAMVDLEKVGAHYAISSLFETYAGKDRIFCYRVDRSDQSRVDSGKTRLLTGRATVTSEITLESSELSYGVLHFGDHNIQAGSRRFRGEEAYAQFVREAKEAFEKGDHPHTIRLLDRHFDGATASLRTLFRDEQRRVLSIILSSTLEYVEGRFRDIYDRNAPLLRFLADIGAPAPAPLHTTAEFVLNSALRRLFAQPEPDLERIRSTLALCDREAVAVDKVGIGFVLGEALERVMTRLAANPGDPGLLETLDELTALGASASLKANLWGVQNLYYEMLQQIYPQMRARSDAEARAWVERFVTLGGRLSIRVG